MRPSRKVILRQGCQKIVDVHEITEGREAAVEKVARFHFIRGTGWSWDQDPGDATKPAMPTGNAEEDAAQGIVNLFRG